MVFLVEDDRSYQRALQRLLNAARLPVKAYGSAEEFLSCPEAHQPGCLLLDMGLPGASGMDLLEITHHQSAPCQNHGEDGRRLPGGLGARGREVEKLRRLRVQEVSSPHCTKVQWPSAVQSLYSN
jgi:CheY-like chemotaxis protein